MREGTGLANACKAGMNQGSDNDELPSMGPECSRV